MFELAALKLPMLQALVETVIANLDLTEAHSEWGQLCIQEADKRE
jgi:hypothetical protein